jgi:hypothetical protein
MIYLPPHYPNQNDADSLANRLKPELSEFRILSVFLTFKFIGSSTAGFLRERFP